MDTRRLGFALMVALVISIAITSVFYSRISRQQAANRPKTKKIISAAADLQPGTPLTAENLGEIDWPETVPLEGMITKREDAVGRVLFYSIGANEPLRERDLAGASSSLGLAAKIPNGMRATAIKVNEVNNIAGFLFPGAKVDVLVTLRGENNSNTTRTVLQNVQILSAGNKIEPDPQGKPENVGVVTMLVTPEESEKLALAQNLGPIQFVLRNGGDSVKQNPAPVDVAQLSGAPAKVAQPANRAHAVRNQSTVYVVETVAGGKTTVSKFQSRAE
jgi:pilus assembly protein CpaB